MNQMQRTSCGEECNIATTVHKLIPERAVKQRFTCQIGRYKLSTHRIYSQAKENMTNCTSTNNDSRQTESSILFIGIVLFDFQRETSL